MPYRDEEVAQRARDEARGSTAPCSVAEVAVASEPPPSRTRRLGVLAPMLALALGAAALVVWADARRSSAVDRTLRADRALHACEMRAREPIGARAPEPSAETAPLAVLVRARVANAHGAAWALAGDECVLAIRFGADALDCWVTVRCPGRRLATQRSTCAVRSGRASRPEPRLDHVRSRGDGPDALELDLVGARLVVRAPIASAPVEAVVVAVTSFDPP